MLPIWQMYDAPDCGRFVIIWLKITLSLLIYLLKWLQAGVPQTASMGAISGPLSRFLQPMTWCQKYHIILKLFSLFFVVVAYQSKLQLKYEIKTP